MKNKEKFISDYGITDPEPVISRYDALDERVDAVFKREIQRLDGIIANEKQMAKVKKFNQNLKNNKAN